jgi:Xaa-Pro aminopeptidase
MKAGVNYTEYHLQFHQRIAKLLRKHQIVNDMSEEAMVENDLTGPFMPHGIGHPLGLQVHDVAGLCRMIPVRIWRRRPNILTCAAPVFCSRVWC